jgi:hypothetical protein
MRVTTALISPEGAWLPASGPALHQALGYPDPDFDAAAFAVRNLGYIRIDAVEDALIDIECHPMHVSAAALAAAQRHLESSAHPLFRLRYLTDDWHSEVVLNPSLAARRMGELCARSAAPARSERFQVTEIDLARLSAAEGDARRALLQKWRASFGHFDDTVLAFVFKHGLGPSFMVIGMNKQNTEPVFRYIGEGFWGWGPDFYISAVGDKVENQPDKSYGAWVVQFYRDAAASGRPRFDHVEARIENSARGEHYSYERLILPWSTASGEALVTLSSRMLSPERDGRDSSDASGDKWRVQKSKRSS